MTETSSSTAPAQTYPHLFIRWMAGVYGVSPLEVRVGAADVFIDVQGGYVQHPHPFEDDETVSAECRALLLDSVLDAVRRTRFRMCVVWSREWSTYVEADGSFHDSSDPPSSTILIHVRHFNRNGWSR